MEFIQIIEMTASDIAPIRALDEQWAAATEGKRTARRSILTRDRNDPDRYRVIVFFDDYDAAMQNSQLPETQEFAGKMASAVDGPLAFLDLDVVEDRS